MTGDGGGDGDALIVSVSVLMLMLVCMLMSVSVVTLARRGDSGVSRVLTVLDACETSELMVTLVRFSLRCLLFISLYSWDVRND